MKATNHGRIEEGRGKLYGVERCNSVQEAGECGGRRVRERGYGQTVRMGWLKQDATAWGLFTVRKDVKSLSAAKRCHLIATWVL